VPFLGVHIETGHQLDLFALHDDIADRARPGTGADQGQFQLVILSQ
jgi:hypothetical protein